MSVTKISPLPRTEMDALLLGRLDELTVSETNSKSKSFMGVLVSILVLLLISSMIVAAIVIINPEIVNMAEGQREPREAFTIEESMLNELGPMGFSYQWTKTPPIELGGQHEQLDEILFDDSKNLKLMTLPPVGRHRGSHTRFTATVTALVKNTSLLASVDYSAKLSPSHRYLLIATAKRRQFRHSSTARYYLYDNKLDLLLMLSTKQQGQGEQSAEDNLNSPPHNSFEQLDSAVNYLSGPHPSDTQAQQLTRFQVAEWFSSEGRDSLLLVQDNDIYLVPVDPADAQQDSAAQIKFTRLTHTGKANEIWNGVPDWLYEEEILAGVAAYDLAPNGTTLAYMSFNDSLVDLMPYTVYGPSEQIIPSVTRIRYPKAGRVNPLVSVHLIDVLAGNREEINLRLPEDLARQQHYIYRIKWLTNNHLSIIWVNRSQNEAHVVICSRRARWNCEKNLRWASQSGWLDLLSDELHAFDQHHYLASLPKFEGADVGDFKHIAKVSLERPNEFTFLTSGQREVISVEGVNAARGVVYYTATVQGEPGQRQAYAVQVDAPEREGKPINCLTCSHYPDECLYNSIKMSPSTGYYMFECEGPGVPKTELRRIAPPIESELRQQDGRQLPALLNLSSSLSEPDFDDEYKNPNLLNQPSWSVEATNWAATSTIRPKLQRSQNYSSNVIDANTEGVETGSLLWTIEDNQALKDKLKHKKAVPVSLRLRVPIANTSYLADVLLMLPPQLGSTFTFRGPTTTTTTSTTTDNTRQRRKRNALPPDGQLGQDWHKHLTMDTIGEYTSQLAPGVQYPMVVDVYAGPGSQKVDYRYNINFGHHLTTARRTIYCMIDGRGSGYQGTKRMHELYHKFGTVEIQDQIEVASFLARNLSFVDPNKVAIWGWSYGGYAAAMALAQSNAARIATMRRNHQQAQFSGIKSTNSTMPTSLSSTATNGRPMFLTPTSPPGAGGSVFECAVSVAPVTNWIYYDTAYTERYMSSPYMNEMYDWREPSDHKAREKPVSPFLGRSLAEAEQPATTNKWLQVNSTLETNYRVPFADFWTARRANPAAQISVTPNNRMDPADLNERYTTGSLLERIGDIDSKRFLLVHGTADDNVHFQQSIMLMKRLIQKNIMFETRLYPDQDHGIMNRADKLHLGKTLSNFFAECFDMAY